MNRENRQPRKCTTRGAHPAHDWTWYAPDTPMAGQMSDRFFYCKGVIAPQADAQINDAMNFLADDWIKRSYRWFPGVHDTTRHELIHCGLGFVGEAGEVANVIKKIDRDNSMAAQMPNLVQEIGDSLCYLLMLGRHVNIDWAEVIKQMNARNAERWGDPA